MELFICCCQWRYVVGRKRVYGPMFRGPGEHKEYWHAGRMMTRAEFEDRYGDCANCLDGRHGHPNDEPPHSNSGTEQDSSST